VEAWQRRRMLLRAMLLLLGLVCAMCLGAAGVLLLLLDSSRGSALPAGRTASTSSGWS
jgi:hypothetical protein